MRYGIPQKEIDRSTNRVRMLKMWTDTFADEALLTQIYDSLDKGDLQSIVINRSGRDPFVYECESVSGP